MNTTKMLFIGILLWSLLGVFPKIGQAPFSFGFVSNNAYAKSNDPEGPNTPKNRQQPSQPIDLDEEPDKKKQQVEIDDNQGNIQIEQEKAIKGFYGRVQGKVVKFIDLDRGKFSFKVLNVLNIWNENKAVSPHELKGKTITLTIKYSELNSQLSAQQAAFIMKRRLQSKMPLTFSISHTAQNNFERKKITQAQMTDLLRGRVGPRNRRKNTNETKTPAEKLKQERKKHQEEQDKVWGKHATENDNEFMKEDPIQQTDTED